MQLLDSVTLDSNIGSLSSNAYCVGPEAPSREVLQRLQSEPDRSGVVVTEQSRVVGAFSLARFFGLFARPYFREIFLRRPISRLLATHPMEPLVLPAAMSVGDASRLALGRPRELVGEPVCIQDGSGAIGLLDMWLLLLAQSRQLELAHEIVQREARQAERIARLKSQFLANMSHEIRTPMNGVIGTTELLLDTPLTAEQRGLVSTLRSSGDALLTIVNDVLDLSKIEAGRAAIETIAFDLHRVLADTVDAIRPVAKGKRLDVELQVAGDVPRAVAGDPTRLRQVLGNLLGNAVKFTAVGRITVVVSLERADATHRFVHVEVRDTGVGVAPESRPLLFQPFSQADGSTTRRYGGTGLGLVIARQLVLLMGGAIDFESEPGRGSTFWFTVRLEPRTELEVPPIVEPLETTAPSTTRCHVLLAEDGAVNQIVATGLLRRLGATVDVVTDGRAAVAAVQTGDYDVVLMDCQMPELDGYDATREIRRLESAAATVPIVAMTANAMTGDRERCLAAGMDDYVAKPITRQALEAALGRVRTRAPQRA